MASNSPGRARLRDSGKASTLAAAVVKDQEKALVEAIKSGTLSPNQARRKNKLKVLDGGLIADPKKEGIPVELQTQNQKPITEEEQKRVDEFMAKGINSPHGGGVDRLTETDKKNIEEITKGLNDKELKEIKRDNRFAKIVAKKESEEALAAGALWDTRTNKWILPPEIAAEAKALHIEFNKLVGELRKKNINKWKYRTEPFFNVVDARALVGVLRAKLEGSQIASEHEKKGGKRRAVHSGPRKKDWAARPVEDDEALLGRTLAVGVEVKRQEGAARTKRWLEAVAYLAKHKNATLGEVTKATSYTVADYRHDIERGALKS